MTSRREFDASCTPPFQVTGKLYVRQQTSSVIVGMKCVFGFSTFGHRVGNLVAVRPVSLSLGWLHRTSLRNTSSHGREPLEDVDEQEPEAR